MLSPFILNENGCIDVFPTIEFLLHYVEPIDVLNQEYEVYDASGRQYMLIVEKGEVALNNIPLKVDAQQKLKDLLVNHLKAVNKGKGELYLMSLNQLLELVKSDFE